MAVFRNRCRAVAAGERDLGRRRTDARYRDRLVPGCAHPPEPAGTTRWKAQRAQTPDLERSGRREATRPQPDDRRI